jgi:hypothetical protein
MANLLLRKQYSASMWSAENKPAKVLYGLLATLLYSESLVSRPDESSLKIQSTDDRTTPRALLEQLLTLQNRASLFALLLRDMQVLPALE